MAKCARKQQDIVATALVRTGRLSVEVNDSPIATEGDLITPHGAHMSSVIAGYWPTVWAENRQVARKGDAASCGHVIGTGSSNVFVGTDGND